MEPASGLYRSEALRAVRLRWLGTVHVVPPRSTRATTVAALVVCTALGAAAVVVEIPDTVSADGVLLPRGGLLKVRAPRSGRVESVAVRNNDTVEAGDELLSISGLDRAPGHRPALSERIASLQRERELLRERLEYDRAAALARIADNGRRVQLLKRRIDAAGAELRARRETAHRYRERADRVSRLAGFGVVARHAVDELAAAVSEADAASLSTEQTIAALEDELVVVRGLLRHDEELRLRLGVEAGARLEAIDRDIDASALESALVVASPDAGRVAALAVRDGDTVQPGQVLLTLYDPGEPLEARLYLPAGRTAAVVPGQSVELQLDAFPHQVHGTWTAVVTAVSPAATPAAEVSGASLLSGSVFEIRASIDARSAEIRGQSGELAPGTTFKAQLVRHRWPLYRWLLLGRQETRTAR